MIKVVFFDIGNTLASRKPDGSLDVLPGTVGLLECVRSVLGLRIGAISNIRPKLTPQELRQLLSDAKLLSYFEDALIVTDGDGVPPKPDRQVYLIAAKRAGVPAEDCLYIGEDAGEVNGALAAGMGAILKPFPVPRSFGLRTAFI